MTRAIGAILLLQGAVSRYVDPPEGDIYLLIGAALILFSYRAIPSHDAARAPGTSSVGLIREMVDRYRSYLSILRAHW